MTENENRLAFGKVRLKNGVAPLFSLFFLPSFNYRTVYIIVVLPVMVK